ncbi:MAG: ATP-binding protein [Candidatus Aminicenantes bacterium]|nr:ATP-binding protein [Candidatus Aminicenantes bacterium]
MKKVPPLYIIIPFSFFFLLSTINFYRHLIWKAPYDGVVWQKKEGKLKAIKVEPNSPADLAGIKKGDLLYSINRNPVQTTIDVTQNIWLAVISGQKLTYQIIREGEPSPLFPSFFPSQKRTNPIYYVLALIGLLTFIVALIIYLNYSNRLTWPFFYFFLTSLSLFCFLTFSPTGELDFLDYLFYWVDKVAFIFFPPLFLYFFLLFPIRQRIIKQRPNLALLFFLPAFLFLLSRVFIHLPINEWLSQNTLLLINSLLDKLEILQFIALTMLTPFWLLRSSKQIENLLLRRQLRWMANGLYLAIGPIVIFYFFPFLFGRLPSTFAELTIVLMALIPMTFLYALVRTRAMDFEVMVKKGAALFLSYFIIAGLYFLLGQRMKVFAGHRLNTYILGILAIILGASLFSPLKKLFQALFDRFFYRRSYKYRRTLLSISRELARERNLNRLAHSLLDLITKAFSLERIALFLPQESQGETYFMFASSHQFLSEVQNLKIDSSFLQILKRRDFLSLFSSAEIKTKGASAEYFSKFGFCQFLPLKVEENLVGFLAMGKKIDGSYLSGEDWELLTTISPSVALAIENAYLYHQIALRAEELERLKDYSENIIESLTVGVAVIDDKGQIIGWNRVLETIFKKSKSEVLGKSLEEVIGLKNIKALFPTETQEGYHLLSEIIMTLPGGEERIFDVARTPLLDNKLIPYGTIFVFEDVTDKVHLQQQLLTSEKLASIGLLSAGVAHEINTPLTGISSYVQLLQKKLTDTHYIQILEKIEAQTERVARIVKNLLNFARHPSDTAFRQVNLKESLQEIISLIDYKLKTMNIKLELNLQEIKPVLGQAERLQQVFINIILNALDAMPKGGKLKINLYQKNQEAVISIADTGMGIKKENLSRIFDPFFTTKGLGKGTGLGLSISYAIIKDHEGRIEVESEVGKGTTFYIYLPFKPKFKASNSAMSPDTLN